MRRETRNDGRNRKSITLSDDHVNLLHKLVPWGSERAFLSGLVETAIVSMVEGHTELGDYLVKRVAIIRKQATPPVTTADDGDNSTMSKQEGSDGV